MELRTAQAEGDADQHRSVERLAEQKTSYEERLTEQKTSYTERLTELRDQLQQR